MRNAFLKRSMMLGCLAVLPLVVGCEGGGDGDSGGSSVVNIAGNWLVSHTTTYDNTGDPIRTQTSVVTINQSGESVWFTVQISDPPVQVPFTGSVSGNAVTFSSVTETLTGTISANANAMSGNYTGRNGDSLWGGTWSAAKQ